MAGVRPLQKSGPMGGGPPWRPYGGRTPGAETRCRRKQSLRASWWLFGLLAVIVVSSCRRHRSVPIIGVPVETAVPVNAITFYGSFEHESGL